jgi:hypothetical protein
MIAAFQGFIGLARATSIAILVATMAHSAYGQFFLNDYGLPIDYALSAEDIETINKSAAPLFSTNAVGQSQAWANPQSGKKGSIELMRLYQLKGMPCRRMEYTTVVPSLAAPHRIIVDWCKIATGEWKRVDPLELEGG